MIKLKSKSEIAILKEGGHLLAALLHFVADNVRPGVSTKYLEEIARRKIEEMDAIPAFLNYSPRGADRPFPAALCVSVNDVVVHGIPNEKPKILKEGDVVTIDTGICYKGLYTDSAITIGVGKIDKGAEKLLRATREALDAAIDAAIPGAKTTDIGKAIDRVAKKYKLSPAEDLGGHGVGYSQHEDPFIPNFTMKGGVELKPGMVLAIEPMLNEGKGAVRFLTDGYTVITADGKRSAHFEHTVAITPKGAEILTR